MTAGAAWAMALGVVQGLGTMGRGRWAGRGRGQRQAGHSSWAGWGAGPPSRAPRPPLEPAGALRVPRITPFLHLDPRFGPGFSTFSGDHPMHAFRSPFLAPLFPKSPFLPRFFYVFGACCCLTPRFCNRVESGGGIGGGLRCFWRVVNPRFVFFGVFFAVLGVGKGCFWGFWCFCGRNGWAIVAAPQVRDRLGTE